MPVKEYGVLVGRALDTRAEGGTDSPHFQIHVRAGSVDFRVSVNVLSKQAPSELLYVADDAFDHPLLATLPALSEGFTGLESRPGGAALDFIRGNLFDRTAMRPLPATAPGPDNDLADKLTHYSERAIRDTTARVYAFGARWGPEASTADKIFGFQPGNGVHDIHMNQGNDGAFARDNGVWQDGGLLLNFPSSNQWVAIFLAFQSQAWHTDDQTGQPLTGTGTEVVAHLDGSVRIVGALVNPIGPAPEKETVTLLNAGPDDLDLRGWSLLDRLKQQQVLGAGVLAAGETVRIPVEAPLQLGNRGGLVTLLNDEGVKVDGVAYTQEQASREGITLVF